MARSTLARDISPPPLRRLPGEQSCRLNTEQRLEEHVRKTSVERSDSIIKTGPTLAAIEAGQAVIDDHLDNFSRRLQQVSRDAEPDTRRLPIDAFKELYTRNLHRHGRHFVIHQHDHPIAGVHYDLRLQFSATSTVSFAIPYGLPGNPNSVRPNRMAIETRVHNLWNNLIESASHTTGSLLIWDTGEYEVLPYRSVSKPSTDDEKSDDDDKVNLPSKSDSERLAESFQAKHIRLRLHGYRLPKGYTITLRLPNNNRQDPLTRPPPKKRRRHHHHRRQTPSSQSDSESGSLATEESANANDAGVASDEDEDATIRANNAYTGAANTIGSVHQRHWFLSLDKVNSGFTRESESRWADHGQAFVVMGRDVERSIVTGRNANEVMSDEGVQAFAGRKMWRPVTE